MFATGLIAFVLGIFLLATDDRSYLEQHILGLRKEDYIGVTGVLIGITLMVASLAILAWRNMP